MITDIVVKTKPFDLTVGAVVYEGSAQRSTKYILTSEPVCNFDNDRKFWVVSAIIDKANDPFWIGREVKLYLGDEGVPGYAYDGRPCTLARSAIAADKQFFAYRKWFSTTSYRDLAFDA